MAIKNNKILNSRLFLILLLIILGGVVFSLSKEVYRKHQISRQINKLKNEISELEKNNKGLTDIIQYFGSEDYMEKEARRKLNLAKPGENVIVIAGEKDKTAKNPESAEEGNAGANQKEISNLLKWWKYLFGNQEL